MGRERRLRLLYWGFVAVQWLLFTVTLASAMVRTAKPFETYVSPFMSGAYLLIVAFLLAFLLGASVVSLKALLPLAAGMVIVAGAIFGAVLYSPAWLGILLRSSVFASYAQEQALIVVLPTVPAVIVGAIAGHLVSDPIQSRIETWLDAGAEPSVPWWDSRREQGTGNRE